MIRARSSRTLVSLLCLVGSALQSFGCMTISEKILDQQYYLVEPSLKSLGGSAVSCAGQPPSDKSPSDKSTNVNSQTTPEIKASDALVFVYTDCVKKMLRRRMNLARISRLASSTFAVLTAAAAAALGATVGAPITAITALAATSAVVPEFMRIFGADERAKAYDEGVHLIEEAEGQYLVAAHALFDNGAAIPNDRLTREGAQLYTQVLASVKLVEQLLVAQLPKVEDIQRAQGRIALKTLDVSTPTTTTLVSKQAVSVTVGGGVPPYVGRVVGADGNQALKVTKDTTVLNAFTIEAQDAGPPGRYEVAFSDAANGSAAITFTVTGSSALVASTVPDGKPAIVTVGEPFTYVITGGNPPYTSKGPSDGSANAIKVEPASGDLNQPIVIITATDQAVPGRTYEATVVDRTQNKATLRVTVAPAALHLTAIPRVKALRIKAGEFLIFLVEGGIPPYKLTAIDSPLSADATVGDSLNRPLITVTTSKSAGPGTYALKVQDAKPDATSENITVFAPVILTSDLVRKVQTALKNRNFGIGTHGVDGLYGPDTKKAVQEFKKGVQWPDNSDELDTDLVTKLGVQ